MGRLLLWFYITDSLVWMMVQPAMVSFKNFQFCNEKAVYTTLTIDYTWSFEFLFFPHWTHVIYTFSVLEHSHSWFSRVQFMAVQPCCFRPATKQVMVKGACSENKDAHLLESKRQREKGASICFKGMCHPPQCPNFLSLRLTYPRFNNLQWNHKAVTKPLTQESLGDA